MADYGGKNIFEKIGSFIPGYKGYSEREGRRDTDKLLRMEIARHLDGMKDVVNDIIRQQKASKNINLIPELDRIKNKLGLVADQIRYATYGECGFFDIIQVSNSDLDALYQFDLDIQAHTRNLGQMIEQLISSDNLKNDCASLMLILSDLSKVAGDREKIITEV